MLPSTAFPPEIHFVIVVAVDASAVAAISATADAVALRSSAQLCLLKNLLTLKNAKQKGNKRRGKRVSCSYRRNQIRKEYRGAEGQRKNVEKDNYK